MICDVPADTTPAIRRSANMVREQLAGVLAHAESALQIVANEVRGQRASLVAELGVADAQGLATVYQKLSEAVQAGRGATVEALPTK